MSRKKAEPIAGYDKCGNCINQKEIDEWDKQQKKKQQYIYVARDIYRHRTSSKKMYIKYGKFWKSLKFTKKDFYINYNLLGIKLKKGEQERIPIDIEKAEKI